MEIHPPKLLGGVDTVIQSYASTVPRSPLAVVVVGGGGERERFIDNQEVTEGR